MEDRLYKFARLVDTQSFTKAAAQLHISQPALTTAIKKLERELRAELLVRGGHTFTLTSAGRIAYEAAKELHIQVQNLRLRLEEAANEKASLHLGMIDSIADLLFVHGDYLQELETGTHLSLTVNNSSQLIKQVAEDELDIALIAKPAYTPQALTIESVAEEPLVLVTSTTTYTYTKQQLQDKHISHFLGYNQTSQTYALVHQHFADEGIHLAPTFYSTSPEIMLQLVLAGKGTAVLPFLLVREYIISGKLRTLGVGEQGVISRQIVSLYRTGRTVPQSAKLVISQTKKHLDVLHAQAKLAVSKTEPAIKS